MRKIFLPWSNDTLSAWLWQSNHKTIVSIPELGFSCFADTESEAVFKLFSSLIKYYQALKSAKNKLTPRAYEHYKLLKIWIKGVEAKMQESPAPLVGLYRR